METYRFNSEGYFDPTTYEVPAKVEDEEGAARKSASFRALLYICSPYLGDVERNVYQVRVYSRFVVVKNAILIATHLLFSKFMGESTERGLLCLWI